METLAPTCLEIWKQGMHQSISPWMSLERVHGREVGKKVIEINLHTFQHLSAVFYETEQEEKPCCTPDVCGEWYGMRVQR